MKVHHGLDDFTPLDYAVVTSGTFDGVHVGHQKILTKLKEIARKNHGQTVLITYWPHPRLILNPTDTSLKILNTFEEKIALLEKQGIDHLIKIPFTKSFSQLSSEQFIQNILVDQIGTKKLVIGYDHRFGKNREGSFEHLIANADKYGFEVEEIPRQDVDNIGVSSTKIRTAISEGDVATGNEYLGSKYSITGTVVKGQSLGKEIGFPTANLQIEDSNKLIPGDGVYAVKATYHGTSFDGMLNIGFRPTVHGTNRSIEVNIFDFDKSIYNEPLTINFYQQIRKEIRFENIGALQKQLNQDKLLAIEILNH